ncbi:MAG: DJ-1/PfpI family protein [Gloeobacteraceae cyanobacterium ES-bin-144]|nr:DJ-1/PfpI family protein [Verrucomicrobiales bacterium]
MKKRVLCLLIDGFEEIETVTPVDVLRRAGAEVVIAAVHGKMVTGKCGIRMEADVLLEEVDSSSFDLLLIPGGPGVGGLRSDGRAALLSKEFAAAGKPVAAICAAPLVLMDAGLLVGRKFTAFHSVRDELGGCPGERLVVDGNIITSRGAGTALEFALALVTALFGQTAANEVAAEIMA